MVHYEERLAQKRASNEEDWMWNNGVGIRDEDMGKGGLLLAEDRDLNCRTSMNSTWIQQIMASWQGTCLSLLILVLVICLALFLGRDYVKDVLIWLEKQNEIIVLALFVLLFTIVSFPFMWGYILINLACGYVYGVVVGLIIVIATVFIGITIAHFLMRNVLRDCVASRLGANGALAAILSVIGGPQTFRVIAGTRLTPIPFGLQNAIFAISPVSTPQYLAASVVGLFPTQAINAYLGSTLRSMEEVLSDVNTATTGYIVFAVQVVISVCLMVYVIQKSREVFHKFASNNSDTSHYTHLCLNGAAVDNSNDSQMPNFV